MIIERRRYEKFVKTANNLLWISIFIYSIAVLIYFFIIAFQNILIPRYNYDYKGFIFPVIQVIYKLITFGALLLFSLFIIKKNINIKKSIGLEITALISISLTTTILIRILNNIFMQVIIKNDASYVSRYMILTNYLNYTTLLTAYAFVLFYIGVAMKMVLCVLKPIEIDVE